VRRAATYPRQDLVEVFPNFFLGTLHDTISYPARPKKKRKWTDELFPRVSSRLVALMREVLPGRLVSGPVELRDHEHIAGLTCAVTALCFAAGEYTTVGGVQRAIAGVAVAAVVAGAKVLIFGEEPRAS
jgi:hypothetical protein